MRDLDISDDGVFENTATVLCAFPADKEYYWAVAFCQLRHCRTNLSSSSYTLICSLSTSVMK